VSEDVFDAWVFLAWVAVWVIASVVMYFRNRRTFMAGIVGAIADGFGIAAGVAAIGFVAFLTLGAVVTVLNP